MKNFTGALLVLLISTSGIFAQINFEKGSFTLENGQKTECYIKNEDWINNPSKFEYKLTQDGETKILRITNLKTVVINNAFKFEKHTVPFDDASRSIKQLTYERSPNFKDTALMLNVILEGKASLYSYTDGDKRAFYFKKGIGNIQPLIYKVYTNKNRSILYNKRYQQQLLTELPCTGITEKKIIRVDYNVGDLRSLFNDYNECKGESSVEFSKAKQGTFHLKAFVGAYNSSTNADINLTIFRRTLETNAQWAPTFGLELEYIFPFNRNKWSMFIAPNYTSYEGEGSFLDLMVVRRFAVEYSAIQVPIGFHHYMFLNDRSKLFLSGAILIDIPITQSSSGNFMIQEGLFKTSAGFSIGMGYSFDKYSIEARFLPAREIVEASSQTSVELQQFSVTIGYTIF